MHHQQTLTSVADDSYHDIPLKPTFKVELMSRKMEHCSQPQTNKQPKVLHSIENQQPKSMNMNSHRGDVPHCVVYADSLESIGDSSQRKEPAYYTLINNVFNSANTKMMPGGKQGSEKRASISNYNKRVVELTQHSITSSQEGLLKVAPSSTRSQNSNMLSLDLSEIPLNDALELQAKVNEIKRRLAESKSNNMNHTQNLNNQCQDENMPKFYEPLVFSDEKAQPRTKLGVISTNISPRNQELYISPKHCVTSGFTSGNTSATNTGAKSKLTLRKQGASTKEQTKNLINLNRSDQQQLSGLNPNISSEFYASQQLNFPMKQNSPQLTRIPVSKACNTTNQKKATASTSQLIRNLSQEGKSLRVSQSIKDLTAACTKETMKSHRLTNAFDTKRESSRLSNHYYSPPQMSLNKAISRISNYGGDSKQVSKGQTQRDRKSINNVPKNGLIQNSTLSTIQTAQMVMRQTGKQDSRKTTDNFYTKQNSIQQDDFIDDYDCIEDEEDVDDDYMTNQEKLWNAIEAQMDIKVIEDLLKKQDVKVDAKNVFDDGQTALHYAVHEGSIEIVKLLTEKYKCLLDQRSSTNKTPFHLACIRGDELIIKHLIERGASTTVVDRDGCTPLHYLCEGQNYETIRMLLPLCQASMEVRNRFGKKPADLVCDREIKRLLRRDTSQSRRTSQQIHHSRDRSLSNNPHQKIVKVVKIDDEQEVQKSIQQMFRKFSLFAGKKMGVEMGQAKRRELESDLERKIEEIKSNLKKNSTQSNQVLGVNAQASKRLSTKPQAQGSSQQQYKSAIPKVQPQSCRNSGKVNQQISKLFPPNNQTTNQSGVISQNVSPSRLQANYSSKTQSKHVQKTLNASQSQQSLLSKHQHSNSTKVGSQLQIATQQMTQQRKMPQIRSVSNLMGAINKTNKVDSDEIREEEYGAQDDSEESIHQNHSGSEKVFKQQRFDENSMSQKTGESSHIKINEQDPSSLSGKVNKYNKMTTFSLNQLSDSNKFEDPESKPQERVGPASFIAHQLLGTGSFGEVFLVEKITNGKYYAMKVLTKSKIMGHNLTRYAMTERNVMSLVDHPFIVKLNFAFQTQEKLFLILDYCPGGDLAEYLQLEKRFNEDKARLYSSEILLALEELHRKDIIFRDLKPDNVVLDAEGHAQLTDFGLSKEGVMKEGTAKSFCGSYAYLAPEMLKKVGHGKAVDWYLLGVLIYEMLCGIPPYYANNKEELFENIKNAPLDIPAYISPVAKDLITKLLNRNPKKRLGTIGGADELKRHPFFKAIDWQKLYTRAYKPPEPYLRKRFENFLQMSPEMQTNTEVYEQLRQQALYTVNTNTQQHVPGWSFVSPTRQTE